MTAAIHNVQDFADWLPPMLVKELRQGLRAKMFVSAFVAVQAVMIILLGFRLTGVMGGDYLPDHVDDYQWLAIGATLLILLPVRGLTAISEETAQKTLDLMQLTSMSTTRLVWGKWCALASQTLLLVVALLPYQVLTYFFGEVDVFANLQLLGWLVLASLVLTALCIALSSAHGWVKFVLLGLAALPIGAFGLGLIEQIDRGNGAGGIVSEGPNASWVLMFLYTGAMMTVFFMAVASARVSHVAENTSATIRCTALFTMLGSMIGICLSESDQSYAWMTLSMPMLMWAAMEAMTEQASVIPGIYMSWVKMGKAGELWGRVLYPGWGTGIFFVLLMTAGLEVEVALIASKTGTWKDGTADMFGCMFQFGMAMLFPGAVLSALPKARQRHVFFVLMQVAGIAWFVACTAANGGSRPNAVLLALCPTSAFLGWVPFTYPSSHGVGHAVAVLMDCLMLIWMLMRAQTEFDTIRRGELRARRLLNVGATASADSSIPVSSPQLP
ncbi:MAG: hypothetical protein JWO08_4336 [Verrucomicrobiaceae bacterium]|nr:hypothetical protein [Verrucomicrobiaceae bacterium]